MTAHSIWVVKNLIASLLLPPFGLLMIGAVGYVLLRYKPRWGKSLLAASLVLLYLLSTPFVANRLMAQLEKNLAPVTPAQARAAQAIIILGGGVYHAAPEYAGTDTVNDLTLTRLQYGALLHQQTGLPILVTGGSPERSRPEAELMQQSLRRDFKTPVQWLEPRSLNTAQNAEYSAAMLKAAHIQTVLVVSHAWHLPRALIEFRKQGLRAIPAPTRFASASGSRRDWELFDVVPHPRALLNSYFALHELLGIAWYRIAP